MPTESKWFYPAQSRINDYLIRKFEDNYAMEFQDVCSDRVHENYRVWKTGDTGPSFVHFVIFKPLREGSAGAILVFHNEEKDFMTYSEASRIVKLTNL